MTRVKRADSRRRCGGGGALAPRNRARLPPLAAGALAAILLWGCTPGTAPPVIERPTIDPDSAVNGIYTVRRGDTLYSIAWAFDWEYRALAQVNGIRPPYVIHPGQKLIVDRGRVNARSAREPPPRHAPQERISVAPTPPRRSPSKLTWQWPVEGRVVTEFGRGNKGIDLETSDGATVVSAADGEVVYAGKGLRGIGQLIIIKHGPRLLSAYGHRGRTTTAEGRRAKAGERIAETGNGSAERRRLHFEIRRDGEPLDPRSLLPRR